MRRDRAIVKFLRIVLVCVMLASTLMGLPSTDKVQAASITVADSWRLPLDGTWSAPEYWVFGKRAGENRYHLGEDVWRNYEAPVYAAANGIVKHNTKRTGYGYVIIIEHTLADGTYVSSVYGHLRQEGRISVNTTVTKGQLIGYISTNPEDHANTTPHLHFGIRSDAFADTTDSDGEWRYRGYGTENIVDLWYSPYYFITNTLIIDDYTPFFERTGVYWWEKTVGFNGHVWWTYADDTPTPGSWGRWNLNSIRNYKEGLFKASEYEVLAFIPSDGANSKKAKYEIKHNGKLSYSTVDQSPHSNAWVSLGTYDFGTSGDQYVRLNDNTGEDLSLSRMVGYDVIKLEYKGILPDITPPTVDAFDVTPHSVSLGNPFTISYTVSDSGGSGLNRVELWRAIDTNGDGEPDWPQSSIQLPKPLSGNSGFGSFSDTPPSIGRYWYGIHVVDNAGSWNDEQNSKTGGSPGDFGPIEVYVASSEQLRIVTDYGYSNGVLKVDVIGEPSSATIVVTNQRPYWINLRVSTVGMNQPVPKGLVDDFLHSTLGAIPPSGAISYIATFSVRGAEVAFLAGVSPDLARTPELGWNTLVMNFTWVVFDLLSALAPSTPVDISKTIDMVRDFADFANALANLSTAISPNSSAWDKAIAVVRLCKNVFDLVNNHDNRIALATRLADMGWFKSNGISGGEIAVQLNQLAGVGALAKAYQRWTSMLFDELYQVSFGQVTVKAIADVDVVNPVLSISPRNGLPGTPFKVEGRGFTSKGSVIFKYIRPDGGEQTIQTVPSDDIGAVVITLDSTALPSGDYRLWAVDVRSGKQSSPVTFSLGSPSGMPDLTVTSVTAPTSAIIGQSISVGFTVKNLGNASPAPFRTLVSLGTTPYGTQIHLGYFDMVSVGSATVNYAIPISVSPGSYWVTVYVNPGEAGESDPNNNINKAPEQIRIMAESEADVIRPTVSLAGPGQGETWAGGTQRTITWTTYDKVGVVSADLYFTADGWQTPQKLYAAPSGVTSFAWAVPSIDTSDAQFMVIARDAAGNTGLNISGTFTISTSPSYPDLYISSMEVSNSTLNVGEQVIVTATVTNQGNIASGATNLKYYFSTSSIGRENYLGESSVSALSANSSITVSKAATIPDVATGKAYIVAVVNPDNLITEELSNNTRSVPITVQVQDNEPPTISYLALQWGNVFKTRHEYYIVFTVNDNVGIASLDFYYSTDNGTAWNPIVTNFIIGSNGVGNAYRWTIPPDTPLTTAGKIKMIARDTSGKETIATTNTFSIIDGSAPEVTVLSPNGGEAWDLGSQHEIKWMASSANGINNVTIYLYYADRVEYITTETVNDGTFAWTLPASSHFITSTGKIKIRVYDGNSNAAEDWSDGYFTVRDPSLPPPPPWTTPERLTTVPAAVLPFTQKDHSSPRVAVDTNGIVHLVYKYTQDDQSGIVNSTGPRVITQQLLYKKLTGTVWSTPQVVYSLAQNTDSNLTGYHNISDLRIAVDGAGNPHIVWMQGPGGIGDITNFNLDETYYSYYTGSSWTQPLNISNNSRVSDFAWTTKTSLPEAKRLAAVGVVSGKFYVMGGDYRLSNYQYDTSTDRWTKKADLPNDGIDEGGAAVVNGKIYVVGGPFDYEVMIYDPSNDTWTTGAVMLTARRGIGVVAVGGKIYAIGDFGPYGTKNEMYDPSTNSWTTVADMPTARGFASVAVVDNLIYVIGGRSSNPDGIKNTVEVYDPVSNSWSLRTSMPTARVGAAVGVISGKIYVAGGFNGYYYLNTVEVYDPTKDVWVSLDPMPTPRNGAVGAAVGSTLYVIGGGDNDGSLATVEQGALQGVTDVNPTVSSQPRIAIDSANNVHVAWRDGYSWNSNFTISGESNIYYKKKDQATGVWSDALQLTQGGADWPNIATDNMSNVHLVYNSPAGVSYRKWNGTSWLSPATAIAGTGYSPLDIASGTSNKVHLVAYNVLSENATTWQRILYSYYDGNSWSSPEEASDRIPGHYPSYPSVVVDSSGNPNVIWEDGGDGSIIYKQKTTLGWSNGIRVNLASQYADQGSDMAISRDSHVYIVWTNQYNGHSEVFYNHANASVDTIPPKVTITAPTAGEYLSIGANYTIRWNSFDNIATKSVDLKYILNGGTDNITIAGNITDTQSYQWNVPNIVSDNVQIGITVFDTSGNSGFGFSGYFSISDRTPPNVLVTSPNGGEVWMAGSQHPITWQAVDNVGIKQTSLLYSTDNGSSWASVATGQSNSGSYPWTVPNKPASTYRIKVIATDNQSNQGEDVSDRPFAVLLPNNPPNVPSNPIPGDASANVSTNVTLSWSGGDVDPGDNVTYDVYFGTTSEPPLASPDQVEATFNPGSLEYQGFYFWKIVATDKSGLSVSSPVWSFLTEIQPVPTSPSQLIATAISSSQIELRWSDNSSNEIGFKIERRIGAEGTYLLLDIVSTNATFITDANLMQGSTYYYRVRAYNNTGNSGYSNEASAMPVLRGDANSDGRVNALDITKVERMIVSLDPRSLGADANGDGDVNALDITKVERIIAGLD